MQFSRTSHVVKPMIMEHFTCCKTHERGALVTCQVLSTFEGSPISMAIAIAMNPHLEVCPPAPAWMRVCPRPTCSCMRAGMPTCSGMHAGMPVTRQAGCTLGVWMCDVALYVSFQLRIWHMYTHIPPGHTYICAPEDDGPGSK